MNTKALKHLVTDIEGSVRSRHRVRGRWTIAGLIASCDMVAPLNDALSAGDRLAVRAELRTIFSLMGWPWGRNELWLTS